MADRDRRIDLILQQLAQLPTLPSVALRVLEVTGEDSSSAGQVIELIEADQSLTARILQLVHRADAGVSGEVNTVDRAVVLLGFEAVRSAVLAISVFQTFGPAAKAGAHFRREEFWKHSIAVACCAELLAAEPTVGTAPADAVQPAEAFVCGLLHDLGKVALDAALPKSYDKVVEAAELLRGDIADVERSVIGIDHMVVGKRLAEQWNLPSALRDSIWLHGQTPSALPASVRNPRLVNLVTLADLLARQQHLGYSGNHAQSLSRRELIEAVRLSEEAVARVQQRLIEQIEPRARLLGLDDAGSHELYQAALEQANRELGRVGEQLASRNRRLAIRARFFDALAQFQGELRPDASPGTVLQAIGQTAVGAIQASPVAVFSAMPTQELAEVVLVDESGDVVASSVVDRPPRLSKPAGGDGPVLATGDELEWLLGDVSPRLAGDQRFWICLEAEGTCIGGVVWGARTGESQRLSPQAQELAALAGGWSLALRTAQIREESRTLAEQLAEANRQLHTAQAELLRRKTLATVGEMAAGAAHEMNNPLAIISGRAQVLASQLSDPKLRHGASAIVEAGHRLSQMITDLMEFARPQAPKPAQTDLSDLVDRALHEAKTLNDPADRKIEVTMSAVPPVMVDPQQVRAALVEVMDNAIQATDPATGQIVIHGAYDAYSARVVVSVTDNGCGMDEETLKRAFDPFFSSKPAGRRRGLGLAKALRWVESSGGMIRLESRPSAGTRAMVLLPAAWPVATDRAGERKAADA
jgi:putative nucleotidyltransferase with HDIG domain